LLKSAKELPVESKPPKTSWLVQEKVREKIEALQAYAVDACADEQRKISRKLNVVYQKLHGWSTIFFLP